MLFFRSYMPFPAIHPALDRALANKGYAEPTPVQAAVLEGHGEADMLVSAQTGSGKTAAFALPLLQSKGRVLNLAQLHDSLYGFDLDVGSNTVNVHVHHLRKKLGSDIIDTVRGIGFRLGARYCQPGL